MGEAVLQMRLFFFLTSVAVVVVAVLLAMALWYGIRIIRRVDAVMQELEAIARKVREGVDEVGELAEEGVDRIQALLTLLGGKTSGGRRKRVREQQDES
jgi:HAMP domain-containing protein